MDINRRSALVGSMGLAAAVPLAPSWALQDTAGGGAQGAGMTALIGVLSQHPYVKAAQLAFTVIGAIASASAQRRLTAELKAIRKQLSVIEGKIDELFREIGRLKNFIDRRITEQKKNELIVSIGAQRRIVEGVLAGYEDARIIRLTRRDRETILDATLQTVELAFELQAWGDDAFIALGDAYALLLLSVELTGERVVAPEYVQGQLIDTIGKAVARFSAQGEAAFSRAQVLKPEIPVGATWYYLGDTFSMVGMAPVRSSFYARLLGSAEEAFRSPANEITFAAPGNLKRRSSALQLGSDWKGMFAYPVRGRGHEQFRNKANALAAEWRAQDALAKEALSLALSGQTLIRAMGAQQPAITKAAPFLSA